MLHHNDTIWLSLDAAMIWYNILFFGTFFFLVVKKYISKNKKKYDNDTT